MSRRYNKPGFTLVELLVVIAIIGVLVALLLPAVQAARESARKMQCTNNAKQITLAFHNYAVVGGGFPNRWCNNSNLNDTPRGWGVTILPFMEQQALFDQFDKTKAFHAIENAQVVNKPVNAYICPSTPGGIRLMDVGPSTTATSKAIAGDYVVYHQLGYTGSGVTCSTCKPAAPASNSDDGLTTFAMVTDGLSNTILISEQAGRPSFYKLGIKQPTTAGMTNPLFWGAWASFQSVTGQGFDATGTNAGGVCSMNCQNGQGAYSFHEGGGVFGFCDGSVRFINENIPLATLLALESRNGGETDLGGY
jgi:prepilin-type N-terminal cleavage/methylation domain-containing protein